MMKRPNILFLIPDQHRKEWLPYNEEIFKGWGMEKLDLHMPNVEKIMSRGCTFLNTITPSPLCAPARACFASGTKYEHCETPGNDFDYPLDKPTIYNALKTAGYEVLGAGKFDLRKYTCDWFNTDNPRRLGFTNAIDSEGKMDAVNHYVRYKGPRGPYMKYLQELGYDKIHADDLIGRKNKTYRTPIPDEYYCDNWIAQNAMKLIDQAKKDRPWFIQVNFNGPHAPFDVTERMFRTVKDRKFELAHDGKFEENAMEIRQCYAAMIENIDRNIGLIIKLVEERGELDNTVIVYASDHGEMLGDHGKYGKAVPYRGSIDIPLVIALPDAKEKGIYSTALVELQDLTSTFAELAGAKLETALESISLLPLLQGKKTTHRQYQTSALSTKGKNGFKCVLNEDYKYIEYGDGEKILFDRRDDVWEDHNVLESNIDVATKMATIINAERVRLDEE